jgi:hypothetical protein
MIHRITSLICNIKAFSDVILLIFHAKETCKSTTHNPGPHPTNLTMNSIPTHDGPISITTAILQQTKMKGNATDNLLSRCYYLQHAADKVCSHRAIFSTPWFF